MYCTCTAKVIQPRKSSWSEPLFTKHNKTGFSLNIFCISYFLLFLDYILKYLMSLMPFLRNFEWKIQIRLKLNQYRQLCTFLYISYVLNVQSVTKSGLAGMVPMSTAICVLCFKFQIQKGTLGTKLDTRSILCFIHEKWSLERSLQVGKRRK